MAEVIIEEEVFGKTTGERIYEAETGVLLGERYLTESGKRPGRPKKVERVEPYVRLYKANGQQIVKGKMLTVYEMGLLTYLIYFCSWESNYVVDEQGQLMSETDIADKFGLNRSQVHETIASLNRKGFVSVVKRGGNRPNYVIVNSHVAFFGKYMRNPDDHKVFANVEYKPVRPINYKEPPVK